MRMWLFIPQCLCNQHLKGEHCEMHMFVGTIKSGKRIDGYLEKGLVIVSKIQERHDILAQEMLKRKMSHQSPIPEFNYSGPDGFVDPVLSFLTLSKRCPDCLKRMVDFGMDRIIRELGKNQIINGARIKNGQQPG